MLRYCLIPAHTTGTSMSLMCYAFFADFQTLKVWFVAASPAIKKQRLWCNSIPQFLLCPKKGFFGHILKTKILPSKIFLQAGYGPAVAYDDSMKCYTKPDIDAASVMVNNDTGLMSLSQIGYQKQVKQKLIRTSCILNTWSDVKRSVMNVICYQRGL